MRNSIIIVAIMLCYFSIQSQNIFLSAGTVAGKNAIPLTSEDLPHIGYRAGVDFSINSGSLYVLSGIHYMKFDLNPNISTSIFNHIAPLQSIKGRLGMGINVVNSKAFKLRTKLMASAQYADNKMDDLILPDPYTKINQLFMGIDIGVGISVYCFTIDVEYEKGMMNAITDADNSTFDFLYLTAGFMF